MYTIEELRNLVTEIRDRHAKQDNQAPVDPDAVWLEFQPIFARTAPSDLQLVDDAFEHIELIRGLRSAGEAPAWPAAFSKRR